MGWLNGKMSALQAQERVEFIGQQALVSRRMAIVLIYSTPVLFLIGWARDLAVLGDQAYATLGYRLAIALVLLGVARLVHWRRTPVQWIPVLAIGTLAVLGTGIALTIVNEPARLSMAHAVFMLILMLAIPLALRASHVYGVVVALLLPMYGLLAFLDVTAGIWAAYTLYLLIGLCFGLFMRRNRLDMAVELYRLRRQLQQRARADTLTGVLNRDGWLTDGRKRFDHALGCGEALSVIYLDLDHFKQVNDVHGHAVGDGVLEAVAEVMRSHLRAEDVVARLGGEEFVALLPGIAATRAHEIAERIRLAVQALEGPPAVTVSAGVYQATAGESLEHAMQRADLAMLQAKREGRNRVLLAT